MPNDAFTAGQTLTAAEMNLLPFGYITKAGTASTQTSVGTSPTDLTSLTVTFTALATRRYLIQGTVNFRKITSGGRAAVEIVRGSTVLQTVFMTLDTNQYGTLNLDIDDVPGGGSVTYKLRGYVSADTMTVNPDADAETLSLIRVIDIGQ